MNWHLFGMNFSVRHKSTEVLNASEHTQTGLRSQRAERHPSALPTFAATASIFELLLGPRNGALRSFFQASERIVNAIAYNERTKRFFVPTVANEIYCLSLKSAQV
jgi:hypothetical protein